MKYTLQTSYLCTHVYAHWKGSGGKLGSYILMPSNLQWKQA